MNNNNNPNSIGYLTNPYRNLHQIRTILDSINNHRIENYDGAYFRLQSFINNEHESLAFQELEQEIEQEPELDMNDYRNQILERINLFIDDLDEYFITYYPYHLQPQEINNNNVNVDESIVDREAVDLFVNLIYGEEKNPYNIRNLPEFNDFDLNDFTDEDTEDDDEDEDEFGVIPEIQVPPHLQPPDPDSGNESGVDSNLSEISGLDTDSGDESGEDDLGEDEM